MINRIADEVVSTDTSILAILAGGLLLTVLFYVISPIILRNVFKYLSTDNVDFNQDRFISNSRWASSMTFVIFTVLILSTELELPSFFNDIVEPALVSGILILWIRVVNNIGRYAIDTIVERQYDKSLTPIAKNIWNLVTIIFSIFIVFDVWSIDITPLLASAGVIGVVLGLAARETISNFFGSIALYADNTYQTGDFIEVKNEDVRGYVNDISIRSTQLITLQGDKLVVPNSKLHKAVIQNKSDPSDEYRIELDVGVSYDTDPQLAKRAIREAVENIIESEQGYRQSWFFGGTDSYKIFLDEFGDSAVLFKIFVKVNKPEDEPRMKSLFYHEIYDELERNDVVIPYPQRSVHLERRGDNSKQDHKMPTENEE